MFIKYLDYLSPPITFYYHSFLSHTSIISGILSIISFILIIILAIYFSLDLIQRKDPNSFYFNSFEEDAGIFQLNSYSLFHFISIATISEGYINGGIDFTNFRIVGYENYFENYLNLGNISFFDHWLYGKCNNETDTKNISHLINYDFFENSACIKKYFSSEEQKYYDIDDEKFRWPEIAHGTMNENLKLYSIYLESCKEETVNLILGEEYHCKSDSEIDESFKNLRIVNFYFINNYINVLNYDNPNIKFFLRIETGMYQDQYTLNHLNFNPAKIKTHNGLILDNVKEEVSFVYERNDVKVEKNNGNNIYMGYCFWLKNTMNFYERNYKRIQDIISSIGGIYQIISIIFVYINKLYNNYIILNDTKHLLNNSIHQEKNIHKKNRIHNSVNNVNNIINEKAKIENSELNKEKEYKKYNNKKRENEQNKIRSNSYLNKTSKSGYSNCNLKLDNDLNDKDYKNNDKTKKDKNFFDFIKYILKCNKNDNYFYIYDNFRIKILSEEHLIRNHLNIYNLLKINDKKRNFRRNSYQLKDLIKLV